MQALVVTPGRRGSARLAEVAEPSLEEGAVLVEMAAVGVCGTDAEIGRKPALVAALGATCHADPATLASDGFDVVVECTGAPRLVPAAMTWSAPDGVVCLTGVSSGGRELPVDLGGLGRALVLENTAVFGSVNANRRHYEQAAAALARADVGWLARLITRRVPLARGTEALARGEDDVKAVILGPGAEHLA